MTEFYFDFESVSVILCASRNQTRGRAAPGTSPALPVAHLSKISFFCAPKNTIGCFVGTIRPHCASPDEKRAPVRSNMRSCRPKRVSVLGFKFL